MAISNAEWWMRAAAQPQPEVSIPDRLKQGAELIFNPPYPTPDGKPLRFYKPGESPFTPEQMKELTAIAKMFQD